MIKFITVRRVNKHYTLKSSIAIRIYTCLIALLFLLQGQHLFGQCIPTVPPGVGSSKGITLVTLEQISNPSPAEEGYVNYTATDTAILFRTGNYNLCVTTNTFMQRTIVWVDWNGDGIFGDSIVLGGEMIIDNTQSSGASCYSFQVPLDSKIGYIRLRVSSGGSGLGFQGQRPCQVSMAWNGGDYEDYILEIRSEDSINMTYYSTETIGVIDTCGYAFVGEKDRLMMRLKVVAEFGKNPLSVNKFTFDGTGTTIFTGISKASVYYTGDSVLFNAPILFGTTSTLGSNYSITGNVQLEPGNNYFWLTYDISPVAVGGNVVKVSSVNVGIDSSGTITNKVPSVFIPNRPATILDTINLYEGCNLIPNPSFEMKTCCPNNISNGLTCYPDDVFICTINREVKKVVGWEDASLGSSDYYNSCNNSTNGIVGVPTHTGVVGHDYQEARTGNAYMGIQMDGSVLDSNYREYFQGRLKTPLKAGEEYCGEIYVNLLNSKKETMEFGNQFGMYFSKGKIPLGIALPFEVLDIFSPQISNPSGNILDDTVGWMLISGTFTASGGEDYVVIGNFKDAANTINQNSYYLVDDVSLVPKPIITSISNDTIVCSGDSITLWASGTCQYTWVDVTSGLPDTIGQNSTIKVATNSTASYVVIGRNGGVTCYDMDTVMLIISDSIELNASNDTSICGPGTIGLQVNSSPPFNMNYSWTPTGSLNDSTSSIVEAIVDTSVTFKVVATFGNCFEDSTFINVEVNDSASILINPSQDTTITLGEKLLVNAEGGSQYSWTPDYNISCTNCSQVEIFPDKDITYCVMGTDDKGCSDSACVNISVDVECFDVFVANVFSPNGDGNNEKICVYGNCLNNMMFRIFDRWGRKVFETDNPSICWEGKRKGKRVAAGVYVYVITGELFNGNKIDLKGNITLIR